MMQHETTEVPVCQAVQSMCGLRCQLKAGHGGPHRFEDHESVLTWKQIEPVYCASEAAIMVATRAWFDETGEAPHPRALTSALLAAHAPSLGSNRSVCLRDVIEALDDYYYTPNRDAVHPAGFVTTRFKGDPNGWKGFR